MPTLAEIATAQFQSSWELSQARAEAVKQYLVNEWGVAPQRLTAHGYGDARSVAPNNTQGGVGKNLSTELRIIGQ
jgi:flagellar motor protein MotB